mmetsp:Transcript_35268/g.31711  ORF Transcript_35268/g.31711 Transcript_35268/m.31711 type:complete len:205 (-) Transcript_35268:19-633(-)
MEYSSDYQYQYENSSIIDTDNNSEFPGLGSPSLKKYVPPNEKIKINEKTFENLWRPEYDEELIKLVPRYKNDWKKISKKIKNLYSIKTTPHFLRNYFMRITADKPKCPKINFNRKLDATIAYWVSQFGLVWTKIAEKMDISDPMKIKNRYYSQIKKKEIYDELLEEAQEFMKNEEVAPSKVENDNESTKQNTEESHASPIEIKQ